jgi:competence protein ComEA
MSRSRLRRFFAVVFLSALPLSAGAGSPAEKHPPAKPIDLNLATVEQLEQLPGVGPSTAMAIVRFREKSGRFQRVEDLLAVHGISQSKLEKLRPYVTVKSSTPRSP